MASISSFTFSTHLAPEIHRHKHGHILLVLTGEFHFAFNGHSHVLTPKELGFIPPDTDHEYSCTGSALTLNIPAEMVKPTDLLIFEEHCVMEISEKLEPLISLIKQETAENGPSGSSLRYLFYYLYDKMAEQYRMPSVTYMEENYAENITISQLAALENYNPSYYTGWFKERTGLTPGEYLRAVRIEKAKEILATTGYRVIDVAMQTGYQNSSSFTRAFRELVGQTPVQYRKASKAARAREDMPKDY